MSFKIEMHFDGGLETYSRGIDKTLDGLKDFSSLFDIFIKYFEGKDTGLSGFNDTKSPIIEIFESEGALIGGDWSLTTEYEKFKEENWEKLREYSFAYLGNNTKQILSGRTLYSLVQSESADAIRQVSSNSMVYGTSVDYADYNQTKRKILDFYPEMEHNLDKLIAYWLRKIAPELQEEVTE